MSRYCIHFDYGDGDFPPEVYIWEDGEGDILRIFETPTSPLGEVVKEDIMFVKWVGEYSYKDEDWEIGPLTKKILGWLQEEERERLRNG